MIFSSNSFSLRAKTHNDCRYQTWTHQDVDCQDFEVWNIKVQSCTDLEGNSAVFCILRTSSKGKRKRTSPGFGSSLSTICIFYECIWGPWEAPLSGLHQELLERWGANHPRIGLSCNISQTNFRIQTWFVISSAIGELISDFCHRRQNMIQKPGTDGLAGIRKIAMAGKNGTRLAVSMSMRRMRPELFVFTRDEGSIWGFLWWKTTPKFHSGRKSHGFFVFFFKRQLFVWLRTFTGFGFTSMIWMEQARFQWVSRCCNRTKKDTYLIVVNLF